MSAKSHVVGIVGFAVAVALGIGVTRYFRPKAPAPPPPPVVEPAHAPAPPDPAPPSTEKVSATPEAIVLDAGAKRATVRLRLLWSGRGAPPSRVWVYAWFFDSSQPTAFAPDAAVEVDRPFPSGSPSRVEVNIPCPWATSAPASSLYANVNVSSESAAAAVVPESRRSRDVKTATSVVVQSGGRSGR